MSKSLRFVIAQLDFMAPDEQRFPCLRLAREAMQEGGTSSTILNAANEIAVNQFLEKRIQFTDIARVIETVLENVTQHDAASLDIILEDDKISRDYAMTVIKKLAA